MTRRLLPLLAALAAAGCGGDDGGGEAQPERVTGNGVDRAFVAAMIPHHESAIEMAEIARDRARTPFV